MKRVLAAGLMAALLSGCVAAIVAPQDRLLPQSRYGELRELMEPKVAAKPDARTGELVYLCLAYAKTHAYDRLFPCLKRFQARIDGGDKHWVGFDMSAMPTVLKAQAEIELGDLDNAVTDAEAGQRLAQSASKYMRIMSEGVLSLAYAQAGRRADAERAAGRLAAISPGYSFLASDKYNALARTRMALGDWSGALDALDHDNAGALKGLVDVVVGAPLSGGSIFAYVDLPKRFMRARALMELGRTAEARQIYDALLADAATEQNADLLWIILDDRGRIAQADGDPAAAESYYRRGVKSVEVQRGSIRAEAGRIGFVGDKQGLYRHLVDVLLARNAVADAFTVAEQAKSRALVDMLGSRSLGSTAKAAPVAQLVSQLHDAQQALLEIDSSERPAAGGLRAASVSSLANELRAAAPEVASLITVSSPSLAQVQSLLGEDETLVEYFGGGQDLVAFVVTRAGADARRLNGQGLAGDVVAFRRAVQDPDADSEGRARGLYARLLEPLSDLIRGDHLLIVPHGPLHYLPFAALHDSRDYLIARYSIRILPAAGVMPFLAPRRTVDDRILLLGDPDVADPSLDLPGAQQEVEAIHALWPNSTVLVRGQASKAALQRLATAYQRLHFATHGTFRPQAPLTSGLLLAADSGGGGGLLTVADLYGLSLNADLVTLSACETGLGAIENGDDVVGFSRGFLFAGARSIVSSLWKVSDDATRDLMVNFYGGLAKGLTKREALRQAQLTVRRERADPFFWAAFELTGAE